MGVADAVAADQRATRAPRSELTLDVSAGAGLGERLELAASVHRPAGRPRAVLVCWAGGSYSRAYWDMHITGHAGYSFADHLAATGHLVVAADHLGVGASSRPADGDRVDSLASAAAAAAFVARLRDLLAEGDAAVGGVPLPDVPVIGIGHSLGAHLVAVAQARHRAYDGVVLLGFTHGRKDVAVGAVGAAEPEQPDPDALRETAEDQARAFFGDTWDDVYGSAARGPNHSWLHRPDVPAEVIAADDALSARWPRQCYVDALLAGYSATFAAEIACPVLVGFGDHDVPPVPHADVAFYTASPDVTLYVLADAAHCHNFASTRRLLWDRIDRWVAGLAPRDASGA
jgi:alpha-beta hydrolase superfamily lysophospholipase